MTIIGKKTPSILDPRPTTPVMPRRPAPQQQSTNGGETRAEQASDYNLHPKAQEAAAVFSDAMRELDNAREIIRALQHRVDVQDATIKELQHAIDGERSQKEKFQRFGATACTLIEVIARAAVQARDAALEAAIDGPPRKQVSQVKPKSEIESEIETAVNELRDAAPRGSYETAS